ncbi:hypothetical protein AGMMS49944_30890 [Spirochaetia bacterium]|nr:hypothetical protein AGMMS49944_30890 [Spirochaetia bacterium]
MLGHVIPFLSHKYTTLPPLWGSHPGIYVMQLTGIKTMPVNCTLASVPIAGW